MADGRRGRQQLEELSPAAASLAVSVITVTVLLTVIAHGASAEPLARRYGAAAGPGTNGDHGLPRAGLSTNLSFPEIAGGMFLSRTMIKSQAMSVYRRLGACSRSQAVTRSRLLGLLEAGRPGLSSHQEDGTRPGAMWTGTDGERRSTDPGPRVAGLTAQVSRGTGADASAHPPDTGAGPGCTVGASG